MSALRVSTYQRKTDRVPVTEVYESFAALLDDLQPHQFRSEKDGPLFSPAEIGDGKTRANKNVRCVHFGVLDLDDISDAALADVTGRLSGAQAAIYTTWRHPEASKRGLGRYRVLLAFTRPVLLAEWPTFWRLTVARFAPGAATDETCKDASRMYFLPSLPLGCEEHALFLDQAGAALDVDALLAASPQTREAAPPPTSPIDATEARERLLVIEGDLRRTGKAEGRRRADGLLRLMRGEPLAPPGERDDEAFRLAQEIARRTPVDIDAGSLLEPLRVGWEVTEQQGADEGAVGRVRGFEELVAKLTRCRDYRRPPEAQEAREQPSIAFVDPEPAPEPVEVGETLDELVTLVRKHVILSTHEALACALWVLHTWIVDRLEITARLVVTAPTKQSGKTRLLKLLAALVRRALPTASLSPAALYRSVEAFHPTLLVDEADAITWESECGKALRQLLDAGYERGTPVVRVERDEAGNLEPRTFDCFGAVAIAGIGSCVPGTVRDRAVPIRLRRKSKDERVTPLRRRQAAALEPLRQRLARASADFGAAIAELEPHMPEELGDRQADVWMPLVAIAEVAGEEWPARARKAALALSARVETDEQDIGEALLRDIRGVLASVAARALERGEKAPDAIASLALCLELRADETGPWAAWANGKGLDPPALASLLRGFGVAPRQVKILSKNQRGYSVDALAPIFDRYL